jgi:hypothetical protein
VVLLDMQGLNGAPREGGDNGDRSEVGVSEMSLLLCW